MSENILDPKIPQGPLAQKWENYKNHVRLVNPANKRKIDIIVVGTGLAGGSAAATLAELGYNVKAFFYQDSARRAHSIAAQGGINANKNYTNDGDSTYRLYYDTIKGGDYRSREANVYRLAEVSGHIIDQCVAQGVPFARDYGGKLDNRSFGGAQVSRTFYAAGQTGQQLLLGCYSAFQRQVGKGKITPYDRHDMLDLVVVDGKARGIIVRNMVTGEIERHSAHAVVLATGGYGNVFFLSTNAMGSNGSAAWAAFKRGAYFANPAFTQIHPTCIPVTGDHQSKLTLMSESLRNDGRIWVPAKKEDAEAIRAGKKKPTDIPDEDRDFYLERRKKVVEEKYGNLFQMYQMITDDDPYVTPMMIYPAVHYTMGGLWVNYELMTTIKGCYAIGECNFSDHGANRLGASALMQGLADGYFVLPNTISNYLADEIHTGTIPTNLPEFDQAEQNVRNKLSKLFAVKGNQTVDTFAKRLGHIMWEKVGMARDKKGLEEAIVEIRALRKEFWQDVYVPGTEDMLNPELEKASRVADFMELGQLMAMDALQREESCGGHFRVEHQTEDGEAKRDDKDFFFVSAWEWTGDIDNAVLHKEPLVYEETKVQQRSYK